MTRVFCFKTTRRYLDDVSDKTEDGAAHPGLKRDKGYIGLLGHTGQTQFRHLRIKKLAGDERDQATAAATSADYFPPPESAGGYWTPRMTFGGSEAWTWRSWTI